MKESERKVPGKESRKGFIFTLLILFVISYMLIEFNIYYKVYEARREMEPTRLRSLVLNEIAMLLREENIEKVVKIVAYEAIYEFSEKSCKNKITLNISKGIGKLMKEGSYSENNIDLKINISLNEYSRKIKELSEKSGMNLYIEFSNIELTQNDPFSLTISYDYDFLIEDKIEKTKIKRASHNSVKIPIIGFVDPLLCRKINIERNIFQSPWNMSELNPKLLFNGTNKVYGRGFFYGEVFGGQCYTKEGFEDLVKESPNSVFNESNKEKILCTLSIEIAKLYHPLFGAVIVFDSTVLEESEFKKSVSDLGVFIGNYDSDLPADIPTSGSILIYSESDKDFRKNQKHYVFDIEKLRKFSICGYYISNDAVKNEKGFSFIRRIESDDGEINPNNIETFLVGKWAPLSFYTAYNYSSVDYLYLNGIKGNKTIGMPGCKNLEMCNSSASSTPTEQRIRFRIDKNHSKVYGIEELICGGRCGEN